MTKHRVMAWLLICLLAPFCLVGGTTTVLCLGSDGHVALESAVDGACQKRLQHHDHDHKGGAPIHSHGHSEHEHDDCCGGCSDVALELEDCVARHDAALFSAQFLELTSLSNSFMAISAPRPHVIPMASPPPKGPVSPLWTWNTVRLLL